MKNYLDVIDIQYSERFIDSDDFARIINRNRNKTLILKTFHDEWAKIEISSEGYIDVSSSTNGYPDANITIEELSFARRSRMLLDEFRQLTGNTALDTIFVTPYKPKTKEENHRDD